MTELIDELRSGRPSKEVLPERSYEGDYARRLGERKEEEQRQQRQAGPGPVSTAVWLPGERGDVPAVEAVG